ALRCRGRTHEVRPLPRVQFGRCVAVGRASRFLRLSVRRDPGSAGEFRVGDPGDRRTVHRTARGGICAGAAAAITAHEHRVNARRVGKECRAWWSWGLLKRRWWCSSGGGRWVLCDKDDEE